MKIRINGITDVGKVREVNEDALIVCSDLSQSDWNFGNDSYQPLGKNGAMVVVADGIGGANMGEKASSLVIESVKRMFTPEKLNGISPNQFELLMSQAANDADKTIYTEVERDEKAFGMGTTVIVAWLIGDQAHIAWCGDSRCYLYHPKKGLKRISKDHSYVQELIDKGEMSKEEAVLHPDSNIITRGLGDIDVSHDLEFVTIDVEPGDMLMLCSDGLSGYNTDTAILQQLNRHCTDVEACVSNLFEMAMEQGGMDNITIAILSVIDDNATCPPGLPFWKRFLG